MSDAVEPDEIEPADEEKVPDDEREVSPVLDDRDPGAQTPEVPDPMAPGRGVTDTDSPEVAEPNEPG